MINKIELNKGRGNSPPGWYLRIYYGNLSVTVYKTTLRKAVQILIREVRKVKKGT